ncbi:MAG: SMP-30/gluconolactonase/LRE family protein [Anaerolineae bacterium]
MSEQAQKENNSGLIMWLNQQSLPIRLGAFIAFVVLIVVLIIALTVGLYYFNVSNFPRLEPVAIFDDVRVSEYVTFDDEEAYPGAVASASDGTLYTGSYQHGAVWRVAPDGTPAELPETRSQVGSVIGLDVGADGALYILDHLEAFSQSGARVWVWRDETLDLLLDTTINADVVLVSKPNDIAVDDSGRVYLLDIALGQVLLLEDGAWRIWWSAPDESYQVAGLAYDAPNQALIIADAGRNALYRLALNVPDAEAERQTIFEYDSTNQEPPRFNGVAVGEDGLLYVASLGRNEIWEINGAEATHRAIAGNYRGSSDVAYDPQQARLYVNNWDQSWLIPITLVVMQVDIPPRLPFSVDVIDLQAP